VSYDVDVPGDFCLGLPGGMVARDVINQAAVRCPESNLFVSGYSQGAMVIRNGLARADESARAKVKVCVLLFVSPGIVCRTNRFVGRYYVWRSF